MPNRRASRAPLLAKLTIPHEVMVLLNWLKSTDRHRYEASPRPYMQPAIGDIDWRSFQRQKRAASKCSTSRFTISFAMISSASGAVCGRSSIAGGQGRSQWPAPLPDCPLRAFQGLRHLGHRRFRLGVRPEFAHVVFGPRFACRSSSFSALASAPSWQVVVTSSRIRLSRCKDPSSADVASVRRELV